MDFLAQARNRIRTAHRVVIPTETTLALLVGEVSQPYLGK